MFAWFGVRIQVLVHNYMYTNVFSSFLGLKKNLVEQIRKTDGECALTILICLNLLCQNIATAISVVMANYSSFPIVNTSWANNSGYNNWSERLWTSRLYKIRAKTVREMSRHILFSSAAADIPKNPLKNVPRFSLSAPIILRTQVELNCTRSGMSLSVGRDSISGGKMTTMAGRRVMIMRARGMRRWKSIFVSFCICFEHQSHFFQASYLPICLFESILNSEIPFGKDYGNI